jgi:uncharacterized membrane protein YphA (DoxX/SURF4 family)
MVNPHTLYKEAMMAMLTRDGTGFSRPFDSVAFRDPARQALVLLRTVFTVAPVLFGLDKFAHWLVDWDRYLAPEIVDALPGTAHELMYVVGAIEVVAGLVVALRPRFGGYLVATWLGAIIVNLLLQADYYDIALRDFGLLVGALALARLASAFPQYDPPRGPADA